MGNAEIILIASLGVFSIWLVIKFAYDLGRLEHENPSKNWLEELFMEKLRRGM